MAYPAAKAFCDVTEPVEVARLEILKLDLWKINISLHGEFLSVLNHTRCQLIKSRSMHDLQSSDGYCSRKCVRAEVLPRIGDRSSR